MTRTRNGRLRHARLALAALFLVGGARPLMAQTGAPPPPADPAPQQTRTAADPIPPGDVGFRFHGYLRSGFGVDGDGKGQQFFRAPLAGSKYRLGNETETYLETTFHYGALSEGDDPGYFDTRVTLAYVAPTSQSSTFATTFSLREAYALARRVLAAQPAATFWAGARYYDRHDVHLTDFFYRDPSGFGGGLEDVSLGSRAKFAVAWIGGSQDELDSNGSVPSDPFRLNKNTFDFRFYAIDAGPARLSVALDLAVLNGDEIFTDTGSVVVDDDFGAGVTGIVESPFSAGRNKLVIQYGSGAAFDFRSILTRPDGRTFLPGETIRFDDVWQFRILNDFLLERSGPWALQGLALYQELENGAASNSRVRWVSLGARPVRRLGRFFSLATELGWDHTEQEGLPGGSLFKLTVAPQITPSLRFLSRPSLRAFATWAHWSDAFRGAIAPASYGDSTRGASFGVQMETWW